jgi:hypothetical protein
VEIVVRLAVGGRDHLSAGGAGCQAAVDAIAVGIVADDENALFGLCSRAEGDARNDERGEQIPQC